MRTVCPICSTTYEVPDALLPPGRAVRCVQCEAQWVARPPEVPALSPVPTDKSGDSPQARLEPHAWTAVERLVSPPAGRPGRSQRRLRAACVAGIVAVVLFGWAMISWQPEITQAWPPSMRLYQMFGLSTPER